MVSKFLKHGCFLTSLIASTCTHAAYWSPHIGIDYKYWGATPGADSSATAVRDYQQQFPKINSAGNIYIGSRINGHFGVDLGYEQSEQKNKTAHYNGQLAIFGDAENAGDSGLVSNRLKAGHLDLSFYWEIYRQFELIFMGGIAYLKPDTKIQYYSNSSDLFTLEKVKSKWVGRGGFGAQYNLLPCISFRALIHFDGTQRIEYIGNDEDGSAYDIKPYKSATSVYVGALYSFSKPRR